ncbi:MAG: hypothetical protein A2289_09205, partial [Deltaproteobacteria bacterium RIFOXYA12_FULL_58_15]
MRRHERDQRLLNNDLVHLWTRELCKHYDWFNREYLSRCLRPAVLELSSSAVNLGEWRRETRTISISLKHVMEDNWTEVLETLRHEMAHQYVDEVLGFNNSEPHGEAWRRACRLLGVWPRAKTSTECPTLDGPQDARGVGAKLRKIRKLLALAENNCNEHEVQSALNQARALMLRHNIELAEVGEDERDIEVRWLGEPMVRIEGHFYWVASILTKHFFVRSIWVPTYIPERARPASQLEVCGEHANVEMAEYIHDSLLRHIRFLWDHYRRDKGIKGIRARNAYWQGLLCGFESQLQSCQAKAQEQGLVWLGDSRLEAFYRQRNPRVRSTRVTAQRDSNIRRDGVDAGKKLKISRP